MIYNENFARIEPLRQGSVGRAVRMLQARMLLPQTGTFTSLMEAALQAWQQRRGLKPDGVYGPVTNEAMTKRTVGTINSIANTLRVEAEVLQTVLQVETAGSGFLPNGLPKILLERHRVMSISTPSQRGQLDPEVCDAEPGGYVGGLGEWARYTKVAAAIGEPAAIACCSWGLPQIMGANYTACGSPDIMQFADAMCRNEDAQLMLLSQFLASYAPMLSALRTKDWVAFAERYNGPKQAKNGYADKLAAAYSQLNT